MKVVGYHNDDDDDEKFTYLTGISGTSETRIINSTVNTIAQTKSIF